MARRYTRRGFQKQERPTYDLGTPELRMKRLAALGPQRMEPDGKTKWPMPNENDVECALGCLLWQGYLHPTYENSKRMYDAGIKFAGWWITVYPKLFAQGTLGSLQPGGGTEEIDTAQAEANLKSASEFLKKERQVYDAVVNTCVYQRLNYDVLQKLRTGLCRLIEWQQAQREAA